MQEGIIMYKATMRSAWAEINLINLEHNLRSIAAKVGFDKEIIAVVKADAYGHGSVKVAQTLHDNGVRTFAVSSIEEALTLREGGINCAEITFRTACAKEAIKIATQTFPDMNVGAGTVINAKQAQSAVEAGAKFIVSPGLSENVAKICRNNGIPYFPGCVTPTEIMRAIALGIGVVKLFPADVSMAD